MKDHVDIKHESRDKMKQIDDIRASQDEIKVELYRVEAGQMKMERNPDVTRQQLNEIMRKHDQMEVRHDCFCPF
jgi:U3 small nucleolar ribonucleoprotein component